MHLDPYIHRSGSACHLALDGIHIPVGIGDARGLASEAGARLCPWCWVVIG